MSGASRVTESIESAPVTASTVSADDMRKFGIRTLAEALDFLSMGVFTYDGSNAVNGVTRARGVGINGDTNRHFLFVIDGNVASSNLGTTTGWSFGLPLEMIDTIEVILGPGSVLYGGNAMLGVINIKTKSARHMSGVISIAEYGVSPSATATGHFASFGPSGDAGDEPAGLRERRATPSSLFGQDAELTGQARVGAQRRLREYADCPPEARCPRRRSPAVGAVPKFGGTLGDYVVDSTAGGYARMKVGRLVVDGQFNQGTQPLVGSGAGLVFPDGSPGTSSAWTITNTRGCAPPPPPPPFRLLYSLPTPVARVSPPLKVPPLHTWPYVLGADRYQSSRDSEMGSSGCPPGGTLGSRCAITNDFVVNHQGLELQGTWDLMGDGTWQLLAGVDGRLQQTGNVNNAQDLASSRFFAPIGSFDAQGVSSSASTGRSADNRGSGSESTRACGATRTTTRRRASPRSRRATPWSPGRCPKWTAPRVSPRGGIVLSPTSTTTLHASVGRAFRPPSALERYTTTAAVELAGDLKPETVTSFEVGIKQKFGAQRALLTGFVSQWYDMIGLGQGSALGKVQFQDTGNIQNYGLNAALEGSFALQRLQYALSFTWGYARQTTPTPDPQRACRRLPRGHRHEGGAVRGEQHRSCRVPRRSPATRGSLTTSRAAGPWPRWPPPCTGRR